MMDKFELQNKSKTAVYNYFLLPWKIPEERSRQEKAVSTICPVKWIDVISGPDPGWSVRGGVEATIGRKVANFARFWPILGGQHPHAPLLDPPLDMKYLFVIYV